MKRSPRNDVNVFRTAEPRRNVVWNEAMNKADHLFDEYRRHITRRWFFKQCGMGLGAIALRELLGNKAEAAIPSAPSTNPLAPKIPHFAAKAKRWIYLVMSGA